MVAFWAKVGIAANAANTSATSGNTNNSLREFIQYLSKKWGEREQIVHVKSVLVLPKRYSQNCSHPSIDARFLQKSNKKAASTMCRSGFFDFFVWRA
jgi:endo-beta-N-acetylglucosaminidase D